MANDAWQRIKTVLAEALDEPPDGRAAFLDRACAGDAALRAEVDSLLAAHTEAGVGFIDTPAFPPLPDDERDPNLGAALGPYQIERLIGHGGMGAVYLARRVDREFERRVAVKMVRRGMDSDALVRRFRHERQILASLNHPHIARLFDGGTTGDGRPYFVMEYVEGVPLDRFADERGLNTPDRIRLFLHVVDAVQHAHEHQIVHRDLKPGNVLVTADGQPKLLDFGIAKLLDAGRDVAATFTTLGRPMTPDYASPEQVRGMAITPATDVYALGVLLYELLTGHRPYRLTTRAPDEIARVVCEQDPERPSAVVTRPATVTRPDGTTGVTTPEAVSQTRDGSPGQLRRRLHGSLDEVVLKALRKDPAARYPSAAALADDLRRYLDHAPVTASRGARRYRTARALARHRVVAAAAVLVIATVAATLAAAWWLRSEPVTPSPGAGTAAVTAAATDLVARRRPSVAVLRFRNLSGRADDAWLATALAEMLTTELGGGGQLRLLAAESVARAERDATAVEGRAPVETLADVRRALRADYVVVGSFAGSGAAPARALRLDVQLLPASGDALAVAQTGSEADLFTLVAGTGRALRQRVGVDDHGADTTLAIRAATPRNLAAARLYAEGLERLRALDAVTAQDRLARAAAAEPDNAMIQMGLASAWTALGYDLRAEAAAERALAASGRLGREQRLLVEGQVHEARKDWAKAVAVYRTLFDFFSDNVEYGLRLAAAQSGAGRSADALVTVAALRALPAPQNEDPRLALVEAQGAGALGDFPHELTAATQAVTRARGAGTPLLLARALVAMGRSHFNQGELPDAERAFNEARQAYTAAGDRAGLAGVLNSLGTVVDDRGDTTRSEQLYREALAVSESVGDRRGMSAALNNLGILLKDHARLAEARQVHERALAIRREIGDRNWTAVSLNNIGVVLYEQDRLTDAAGYYTESLALARAIGDKRSEVRALHNLAIVQRDAGDVAAAQTSYEHTILARAAINDRRGGVSARTELGIVQLLRGALDAARATEEEAAALAREVQIPDGEAQATFALGEIALARGELAAARHLHETALAVRQKLGQTRTVAESHVALGALANEEGHYAAAEQEVQPVLALGHELAVMRLQAELVRARARLGLGDVAGARQAVAAARALGTGTERIQVRWALDLMQARIDVAAGQPERARARLETLRAQVAAKGLVMAAFDTRLVLAAAARAAGDPRAGSAAAALADEAAGRGAGLIRMRAAALAAAP